MFQGVYTAVITPFLNGKIDYDSYFRILDRQIQAKVSGVVPCGTTGESPTLSHDEHKELIKKTVDYIKGRIQVVAGTGSNSTKEACELTESACKDGADGVLSVNPYYNKPTQEGLYLHFKSIAEVSAKPIMLYNIPGRTGVNLAPETTKRLSMLDRIVSIKEATGDLGQMARTIAILPKNFTLLSGDDNLILPVLSIGGKGVVSVVSNLFPASLVKIVNSFASGKLDEARELYYELLPVFTLAFLETNPIPVKAAMHHLGYCSGEVRLPLTPLSSSKQSEEFLALVKKLKEKGLE